MYTSHLPGHWAPCVLDLLTAEGECMDNPVFPKMVAGFWIRLASDAIDAALLALLGLCLSIPFRNLFYKLGESGIWIGLLIAFLYAGLLQSFVGQGQSIAKRLLKIQVLQMNGQYLGLPTSFLRYGVIAMIFYNGWIGQGVTAAFPLLNRPIFQGVYSSLVIVLFVGTILMVPLHPLKRGIHDLIAGSIVVYKGRFELERVASLNNAAKTKRAYLVSAVCGIAVVAGAFLLIRQVADSATFERLSRVQQKVTDEAGLQNVSVQESYFKIARNDGKATKTIIVNGFLPKDQFDNQALQSAAAEKAARAILSVFGNAGAFDGINVVVRTGFNIGIFQMGQSLGHTFTSDGIPVNSQR